MTAMLAYCGCGHTREEHERGACSHLNRVSKRFPTPAPCTCRRFAFDDRLRDSDAFVARVLEKVRAKEGISVEHVEREEALQVLTIALWKTSCKYDSRSHVRFRVYAYLELYNDAIDHFRSERGRHGQHRVFDSRGIYDSGDGDGPADTDRLGGAASVDPADNPDHWAADAGGLLAEGDRPPAQPVRRRRVGDGRGDASGDHRPGIPGGRSGRAATASARAAAARSGAVAQGGLAVNDDRRGY